MKKLNFGCGKDIRKDYINADIAAREGVDRIFDFNVFPYPFADGEFGEIYADNVLEHLDDIPAVMRELHRIAKPNGEIRIIVPYYNCYGAYNDVTHKHYFSHLAFEPFYKKGTRGNYFIPHHRRTQCMPIEECDKSLKGNLHQIPQVLACGEGFIEEEFELKKLKLIPTRIGKIFLFPPLQKFLSFIFGQIIQTIDITLIVKK